MQNRINAIVVDDEKPAIIRMKKLIKVDGRLDVIDSFTNANQALTYCIENYPDVVFLDIDMPEINGLYLGKIINEKCPDTLIVYTTAYSEYTKEAYENYAIGYLLKPIMENKFSKVINIISRLNHTSKSSRILRVRTLGTKSIVWNNSIISFRTKNAEEFFYRLLHKKGEWISQDTFIENFWPNKDYEYGKKQLHTVVYYCRQALVPISKQIIEYNLNAYRLNMNYISWDYLDLINLLDEYENKKITKKELLNIYELDKGIYFEDSTYIWAYSCADLLNMRLKDFYSKQLDTSNILNVDVRKIIDRINKRMDY